MLDLSVTDVEIVIATLFVAACALYAALLLRMLRAVNKRAMWDEQTSFFLLRPGGSREKMVRREYRRIYPRSDVPSLFRMSRWAVVVTLLLLVLSVVLGRV